MHPPGDQVDDGDPTPDQVILAGASGASDAPAGRPTTDAIDVIERASRSTDPVLRILALGAGRRTGSLTDERLQDALGDPDRDVRCRAIELAIETDLPLVALLDDADDLVVETAAWALGEREEVGAVADLRRIGIEHEVAICREAAIASLGAIGDPDGLPAILAGLKDKPAVRRRAVLALAPFDGPDVTAALEHALTDRDRQVRQAAEDLL